MTTSTEVQSHEVFLLQDNTRGLVTLAFITTTHKSHVIVIESLLWGLVEPTSSQYRIGPEF